MFLDHSRGKFGENVIDWSVESSVLHFKFVMYLF